MRTTLGPGSPRSYAAAFLLTAALLTLGGCGDDEPETVLNNLDDERTAELVTGEPFEATAMVDGVLSEHAFRLLDTLVISAEPLEVREGERVRVTGEISDEASAELEARLGTDLDGDVTEEIDDADLFVVATEVEPAR
jgi:hypothetical protein